MHRQYPKILNVCVQEGIYRRLLFFFQPCIIVYLFHLPTLMHSSLFINSMFVTVTNVNFGFWKCDLPNTDYSKPVNKFSKFSIPQSVYSL